VVFVIANPRAELIDWVAFGERKALANLTNKLQFTSRALFLTELPRYYRSLESLAMRDCEDSAIVGARFEELKAMVSVCGFPLEFNDREQIEDHSSEFFTQINNSLRLMDAMLGLDDLRAEIDEFIDRLPTDHFHSNFVALSWDNQADSTRLDNVAILTASYEAEPLKLVHVFADRGVFHAVLFALFSGRTIAVTGCESEAGESFARRLSALSPFEKRFSTGQAGGTGALRHSIVVGEAQVPYASELRFGGEQPVFKGLPCPTDSFVTRVFARAGDETENRLILSISNDAKRLYGRFRFKIAELCGRAVDTEEAVVRGLRAEGFGAGDVPIFKFWMANLAKPAVKPILLDGLG
jgi:hypothetical protein